MMEKRGSKRAQILGMPFSVIFSIILIAVFIISAIIAIKIFWNPFGCGFSDNSQEAMFKENLQDSVDDAWSSDKAENVPFQINLPEKIIYVCFLDIEKEAKGKNSEFYQELERFSDKENNVYLYPIRKACEDFRSWRLGHINITLITEKDNPYCIQNKKSLILEKGFYDSLVRIR